jgi:hypothetical protein
MTPESELILEERFAVRLLAYDEALAEGREPEAAGADAWPEAWRLMLARAEACLRLLEACWPRSNTPASVDLCQETRARISQATTILPDPEP